MYGQKKADSGVEFCPNCGSDAAALGDYGYATETHWYAHILCGECLVWRYVEATDEVMQRWETFCLEAYQAFIERDAERLDRERFKDWAATFICSVRHDAILPEDF